MRNRKSRRAAKRLPCLEINFMRVGREGKVKGGEREGMKNGRETRVAKAKRAWAFDFNSREGVLHDLNGIRWRSDTIKETPAKTRTV